MQDGFYWITGRVDDVMNVRCVIQGIRGKRVPWTVGNVEKGEREQCCLLYARANIV